MSFHGLTIPFFLALMLLGRKAMTNLDSILKSRDFTLLTKVCTVRGFSSSHVWMWELDHKEGWAPRIDAFKLWCWRRLESSLDCKKIKSVNCKGNQPWIFIRRTDAEAETPILWPPDAKSQLIGKDPDAGKDCGQEEKGATEDKMVGWDHQLNVYEIEQTTGCCEGPGSLVCCSPWGHNWTQLSNWATRSIPLFGRTTV